LRGSPLEAGLERVDSLRSEPALANYHLLPSVRGDLLQKLGRLMEARAEFERAATPNAPSSSAAPLRACRHHADAAPGEGGLIR
jgi:predicted RNA polymerase sigma factor